MSDLRSKAINSENAMQTDEESKTNLSGIDHAFHFVASDSTFQSYMKELFNCFIKNRDKETEMKAKA